MSLQQEEAAILQWYIDAGVEEASDDEPRNYFAVTPPRVPEIFMPSVAVPLPVAEVIPVSRPTVVTAAQQSLAGYIAQAQQMANEAKTLEELREAVRSFDGCSIKKTATNTVFGDGNPQSKLMLIGEAPGADEDIKGIPFCGVSGKLLDKMLAAIQYDRSRYYITNTLFWRPPGNRSPNADELAMCRPFVEKHVALIDPDLIVLVGGVAAKSLLSTEQGITRLRGKSYTYRTPYRDKEYPVTVIYHPSYLLRQPVTKRVTWQDLLAIKKQMLTAGQQPLS